MSNLGGRNLSLARQVCCPAVLIEGNTMFKRILVKSVAGVAAVGSALAMTVVAGPATTSAAPELRAVACSYPAEEQSTTTLELLRSFGRFGDINRAVATVTTATGPAEGRVRLLVNGNLRAVKKLNANGQATFGLPRYLRAQSTHSIIVKYVPADDCAATRSRDAGHYSVVKRRTQTEVNAPNRVRGRNPVARVQVSSVVPRSPRGKVRVIIRRDGRAVADRVVRLNRDAAARVRFRKMRVDTYKVRVRYLGAMNFTRSTDTTSFRVRRPR